MASLNKARLKDMYYGGMSIPEISRATNMGKSTVRYYLLKAGTKMRSRAEGVRNCKTLGLHLKGKKKKPFTKEHRDNIRKAKIMWANKNAKGTSLKPNGYLEITRGADKNRSVHVVKMEQHIGHKLNASEVVHHVDRNRQNNDIGNLVLMTRSDHTKLHRKEKAQCLA